ncbi:alpha/beta fold hydrolase [Epidermidibacterium keratini]|uniref:Alpha/beta fold hydrolase n=1 Tax=Epidermidibacterium keratini TaxID=1891644 RepID=A0A7L4YRA1_9ACTN|nr:alpha/beta fold hydrolase [Epidermidibacterium keratini]QHC01097.1 alpha/beta fold hydrolase [Epidermidibacterium keratini]
MPEPLSGRLRRLAGTPRRVAALIAVIAILAGLLVWQGVSSSSSYTEDTFTFESQTAQPASLDVTVYVPDSASADDPAPAILLAHGFGGTKDSMAGDAAYLANAGYVVLTYTARGFGQSTGQISLNAPDAEVADAQNLISYLATRDDVQREGDDPVVGITGPSYGGALALLTAGADDRVDAIVPMITWNRLSRVFFPSGAGDPTGIAGPADGDTLGAFKREWAGVFFGFGKGVDLSSLLGGVTGGDGGGDEGGSNGADGGSDGESSDGTSDATSGASGTPGSGGLDPACGRFAQDICDIYTAAAEDGTLNADGQARLDESSPYSVAGDITAPTLIFQGQQDSLFPLSEADVTARQIEDAGTDVKVVWTAGGHDVGGVADRDDELADIRATTLAWFDYYLAGTGPAPSLDFEFSQQTALTTTGGSGRPAPRVQVADSYPNQVGETTTLDLLGPPQQIVNPAGATPGSLSSLPGLGSVGVAFDPPGQAAYFATASLADPVSLVGSARVSVTVSGAPDGTTLFAKVYDAADSGLPALPGGSVMPVVVPPNAGETTVDVTLPAISHRFEPGHRLIVALATTDRAYAGPTTQQTVTVGLASPELTAPVVEAQTVSAGISDWVILLLVIAGAVILGILAWLVLRRRNRRQEQDATDEALLDVPLVAEHLRKAYSDGFVAVRDVSFRVDREQVVGLLGPNGAGKTTALRMLMGLIRPTEGGLKVFGHPVYAGAPVLSRVGSFVEGVGFLPHLSGRENIELYWAATGRPKEDARFEEVLAIAGLGDAIERKVRTYSQGMRQRLAIAQAMLGMPDLLVLDEPTNGLDPPQIAEMRHVLQRYARDGRSVLVSSHQLSEVEQVSTHVVVVNRGEVIASGTVAEVVGVGAEVDLNVDDVEAARGVLDAMDGVSVRGTQRGLVAVELEGATASEVVAALVEAGVAVEAAIPRRRLEDAFLALVGGGA